MSRFAPPELFRRAGQADKKNLKILKISFDKTNFYDILSFYIRDGAENDTEARVDKNFKNISNLCLTKLQRCDILYDRHLKRVTAD